MEFHYIITLTWPDGSGCATVTLNGIITARQGQTRKDLFGLIYQHAVDRHHMDSPNTTFFDLAPNRLPSAGDWPTAATRGGQTR